MDDDAEEMRLIEPENVDWEQAAAIQVKRYDVSRRIALEGGPVASLPLLGTITRFSVEVIHKDGTWDMIYWLDDPVEARGLGGELAEEHGLALLVAL